MTVLRKIRFVGLSDIYMYEVTLIPIGIAHCVPPLKQIKSADFKRWHQKRRYKISGTIW